jgi:hypothetical protein
MIRRVATVVQRAHLFSTVADSRAQEMANTLYQLQFMRAGSDGVADTLKNMTAKVTQADKSLISAQAIKNAIQGLKDNLTPSEPGYKELMSALEQKAK